MTRFRNDITDEDYKKWHDSLAANGGYCPCKIGKDKENICMCADFLESGECVCGIFEKAFGH